MKTKILLLSLLMGAVLQVQGQSWSGSTPGDIYYNSGNVGIGTATPSNAQDWNRVLDVHGVNHAKLLVTSDSGTVKTGIFSHGINLNGIVGRIGTESNHDLRLTAGYAADQMTIKTNGSVGIGVTNPSNAQGWHKVLQIHGSDHAKMLVTSNTNGVMTGIFSHGTNWNGIVGRIGTESSHDLRLMAGYGADQVTIKTNGNVGIGTTSPDSKLAVNGTIHAKEVKVDLTGWSDFVFEKGYPLLPLPEVAAYIADHGHLPDVPNEEEVKANGVNLGEMDAKLLQKIEELTLYMIDFNKKMDALNEEVARLKAENERLRGQEANK